MAATNTLECHVRKLICRQFTSLEHNQTGSKKQQLYGSLSFSSGSINFAAKVVCLVVEVKEKGDGVSVKDLRYQRLKDSVRAQFL